MNMVNVMASKEIHKLSLRDKAELINTGPPGYESVHFRGDNPVVYEEWARKYIDLATGKYNINGKNIQINVYFYGKPDELLLTRLAKFIVDIDTGRDKKTRLCPASIFKKIFSDLCEIRNF